MMELLSVGKIVDYFVAVDRYTVARRRIEMCVLMSVGILLGLY